MTSFPRRLYGWTRDLHLYLGLFIGPFVVVYAITAMMFNHAWLPWGGAERAEVRTSETRLRIPDQEDNLELAKAVRAELGLSGEIDFIRRDREEERLTFPLRRPGVEIQVEVDLKSGIATVEERRTGAWDAMLFLHRMPGPHNVAVRGNWFYLRVWGLIADLSVYLILFLSVTGVYLWSVLRAERKAGLVCLGAGILTFFALVLALTP